MQDRKLPLYLEVALIAAISRTHPGNYKTIYRYWTRNSHSACAFRDSSVDRIKRSLPYRPTALAVDDPVAEFRDPVRGRDTADKVIERGFAGKQNFGISLQCLGHEPAGI